MLLGEQEEVETFWHYYGDGGQEARLYCRELLFEQQWPDEVTRIGVRACGGRLPMISTWLFPRTLKPHLTRVVLTR